jgi:hypothetical protein
MDFTRGQPKRPTILAPAAVDEAPAKAARASTSSLPLPASPEDKAPQGCASTQLLLPKEEAAEEVGRDASSLALVSAASGASEQRAAHEYRRVKSARDGLVADRKIRPEELQNLHSWSSRLEVRVLEKRFLPALAKPLGCEGRV